MIQTIYITMLLSVKNLEKTLESKNKYVFMLEDDWFFCAIFIKS